MRAILSAVGDNELAAAKFALESSKIARNPREQVLLAVGHLQSAHTAYWQTIVKSKNSQFKKGARTFSYSATCLKEQWVCSLMAVCYVYLGYLGEWELIPKAVGFAKSARKLYEDVNRPRQTGDEDLIKCPCSLRLLIHSS